MLPFLLVLIVYFCVSIFLGPRVDPLRVFLFTFFAESSFFGFGSKMLPGLHVCRWRGSLPVLTPPTAAVIPCLLVLPAFAGRTQLAPERRIVLTQLASWRLDNSPEQRDTDRAPGSDLPLSTSLLTAEVATLTSELRV